MTNEKEALFSTMPVKKAILTLSVPTVISQLITVVYNMADTFFIGQQNDPVQVAAATIAMPIFIFLTAFANLFGTGGSSLIARCLGLNDKGRARAAAAFSIWTGLGAAFIYGILILLLEPVIFPLLGADGDVAVYLRQYVFWTVTVGAVPTVMSALLANLIRAEGYSKQAGLGIAMGGILNIALDPLFIFVLDLDIKGAAIATMISNMAALAFFICFILHIRKKSVITLNPAAYSLKDNIPSEVLTIGFPGFILTTMATLSNAVLNKSASVYSEEAVAGMGIAKKIDSLAYAIAQGMTQGTLPLISFNYGAGNTKRMRESAFTGLAFSFTVSVCGTVLLFLFAQHITGFFISDAQTIEYGQTFLKIMSLSCPTTALNFMIITIFQSMGKKVQPIVLTVMRKGTVDIFLMFLLSKIIGVSGIAWSIPISDWIAFAVAICMFIPFIKKLK